MRRRRHLIDVCVQEVHDEAREVPRQGEEEETEAESAGGPQGGEGGEDGPRQGGAEWTPDDKDHLHAHTHAQEVAWLPLGPLPGAGEGRRCSRQALQGRKLLASLCLHFSGVKTFRLTFLRMRDKCQIINVQRKDKVIMV